MHKHKHISLSILVRTLSDIMHSLAPNPNVNHLTARSKMCHLSPYSAEMSSLRWFKTEKSPHTDSNTSPHTYIINTERSWLRGFSFCLCQQVNCSCKWSWIKGTESVAIILQVATYSITIYSITKHWAVTGTGPRGICHWDVKKHYDTTKRLNNN